MRTLIEAHIERSLQPKPAPTRSDRKSRGTPAPGRTRPHVRLTPEQVAELRELNRLGWTLLELANRFGCSVGTITNWRRRFADEHARTDPSPCCAACDRFGDDGDPGARGCDLPNCGCHSPTERES